MTQEEKIKQARDEVKGRLARKAATVQRVLATADGQEMMRILRKEFMSVLDQASPHGPAYRVGTADVIGYLLGLNDFREE
jgi:hypothetical protein